MPSPFMGGEDPSGRVRERVNSKNVSGSSSRLQQDS